MFRVKADQLPKDQSGAGLVAKLEKGKNSTVPLRVTYTIEDGKITHDIHERKWEEWFSELFIKKAQLIEINRRVATALSTILVNEADKQAALKRVHAMADAGEELSAAKIHGSLIATSQAADSTALAKGAAKVDILVGDPSMIDADTCLLDIGEIANKGRGHVVGRPQLHAFSSLANKAIEEIHRSRSEQKKTSSVVPVVEIPRCELKTKRVLVYDATPRMRRGVQNQYKEFFHALFTSPESEGTLVIALPKFLEGKAGLAIALRDLNKVGDISCRQIFVVSTDNQEVKQFIEIMGPL